MNILSTAAAITTALERTGSYLAPVGLRVVLAWEFFEAGLMKLRGTNWFAQIHDQFPFPFDVIPVDVSWSLATWTELVGGVAILIGLGTRLFSFSLIVLTIVATAAVHWPGDWNGLSELLQGYSISDKGYGNYKLPAIYLTMLMPLMLLGPGRLSVDYLINAVIHRHDQRGTDHIRVAEPA